MAARRTTADAHDHSQHEHAGHDHTADMHAAHDHGAHDHSAHDHGAHDHAEHEHGGHHHHDPAQFRRLFWISLILSIPTVVFSHGLQDILGLTGPRFAGSEWIPAGFGTAVFLIGAWVFIRGAVPEVRAGKPGMMTLISLAILVAFTYSALVTFRVVPGMDFWWELATLVTIMLLGHWIEAKAISGAQDALGELAKLLPDSAEILDGTSVRSVALAEVRVGDLVLVRPGAAIPADGEIAEGESEVDESMLTGESVPVAKAAGDRVVAGSISSGALTVRVTATGEQTALAGIGRLVREAQQTSSPTQLLADRAAGWLFWLALAAAAITALVWFLIAPTEPENLFARVVTVLVIACPHALGLAIPLVAQLSVAIGARHGILVRDRLALEQAREIDVVLLDKTGTLTEGRQSVVAIHPAAGRTEEEVLQIAAAIERRAEHPIGRAIVAEAKARGLKSLRSKGFTALPGRGVRASIGEDAYGVVSARVLIEDALKLDSALVFAAREAQATGHSVVYLRSDEAVLGMLQLADQVRDTSLEAVSSLQRRGIRVAMATGDSQAVAQSVARTLGISEVFAEVLPAEKTAVVAQLQAGGATVAMVGDGVNDAPALAKSDIGIAIGAGTDVAIESAEVVLAGSDPRGVMDVIKLSRASYRKMRQNLAWAAGYNVIALPIAAGALTWAGIDLSPAAGAVLMSVSTIVVALNAQLLRRVKLSTAPIATVPADEFVDEADALDDEPFGDTAEPVHGDHAAHDHANHDHGTHDHGAHGHHH